MKYYPEYTYRERYTGALITSADKEVRDPITLRNMILVKKLGCTEGELRNLLDGTWVMSHRESVARILDVHCDRDSFSVYDRQ